MPTRTGGRYSQMKVLPMGTDARGTETETETETETGAGTKMKTKTETDRGVWVLQTLRGMTDKRYWRLGEGCKRTSAAGELRLG